MKDLIEPALIDQNLVELKEEEKNETKTKDKKSKYSIYIDKNIIFQLFLYLQKNESNQLFLYFQIDEST